MKFIFSQKERPPLLLSDNRFSQREPNHMDLCLDLETGDTRNSAAILSIGAVMFDPYSDELGASLSVAIPPGDNDKAGRTWSGSTMEWWTSQPDALAALGRLEQRSLTQAGNALLSLISRCKPVCIWAMSPSFDVAILRHYYESIGSYFPMQFGKERDVRTIKAILPVSCHPARDGTHHDAVADAIWQARLVQKFFATCFINDGEVT
jgi:exodeoxyribonuclease VIII